MSFPENISIQCNNAQRGAALILFFMVVLLTGVVFVVSTVSVNKSRTAYESETSRALAQAKESLISYAVSYYERANAGRYGFLPCPEQATSPGEGREQGNCDGQYINSIGRLPWKTLGIDALKDASGECLWYAVSGIYKNGNTILSEMHNADSSGMFELFDDAGNQLKGPLPEDRVVAVVIAPGRPVVGQNRPAANTNPNIAPCKVLRTTAQTNIASYLDSLNGINNAVLLPGINQIDQFVTPATSAANANLNDRIMTITQSEIFDRIGRQINPTVPAETLLASRIDNLTEALARCLAGFGSANPVPPGGGCDLNTCLQNCGTVSSCENQCDNDRVVCRNQCDTDLAACLAGGGSNGFCNSQRGQCYASCNGTRNSCRSACGPTVAACQANCNANCTVGGGGGGGNDFRLPWPAAVNLGGGVNYRVDVDYVEQANIHMGRFPYDVSLSSTALNNEILNTNLLDKSYCNSLTLSDGTTTVNFNSANDPYRRLWGHWKDHFFYALAQDFDLTQTTTPDPCVNCLTVNGSTNRYAGIVMFAGDRSGAQTRTALPDVDSKQLLTNYLEGVNASNTHNGTENYVTGGATNEIAFCVNEDMSVTTKNCP